MHRLPRPWTTALALGVLAATTSGCLGSAPRADTPVRSRPPATARPSATRAATSAPSTPPASPTGPRSTAPTATAAPATPTDAPADAPAVGASDPAVAPASPVVSPTTGSAPRLVRYSGDGVTVQRAADADRLHGTSPEFRRFVVAHLPQGQADCGNGSITVKAWRADGFAVGDVFECPGGYRAIWGTAGGGSWRQLVGTQDVWSCSDLHRWSVPTSIAGDKCSADGGLQEYRQA
ncbi:MAG TPA: hypothetical protein VI452_16900 [Marmoricola sp.]